MASHGSQPVADFCRKRLLWKESWRLVELAGRVRTGLGTRGSVGGQADRRPGPRGCAIAADHPAPDTGRARLLRGPSHTSLRRSLAARVLRASVDVLDPSPVCSPYFQGGQWDGWSPASHQDSQRGILVTWEGSEWMLWTANKKKRPIFITFVIQNACVFDIRD